MCVAMKFTMCFKSGWMLRSQRLLLTAGIPMALAILGESCVASEQPIQQDQSIAQNIAQAPVQVASVLQVSGSATRFSISAQHADVKNALKLIFDQAHRQFTPDGSVAGNITLTLTGQTFSVVLDAVCRQTFLRWKIDKDGIYQITRDDEAVRQLVARTRMVNALLREQLARLGYDVPGQNPAYQQGFARSSRGGNAGSAYQENVNGLRINAAPGSYRGGGLGSGPPGQPALSTSLDSSANNKSGQAADKTATGAQTQVKRAMRSGEEGPAGVPGSTGGVKGAAENGTGLGGFGGGASGGGTGSASGGFGGRGAGGLGGGGFGGDPSGVDSSIVNDPVKYRAFLKENGLVSVIIPRDKPRAVSDVLLELSQQSNVPILIDPSIPRGYRFRLTGSIAPCSLSEALSLLSIPAHLEVRYVGNGVLVSAKPEFQVFFGESTTPRASYGNTQNANQNTAGQGGQQAAPGQTQSLPAATTKAATPSKVQQKDKELEKGKQKEKKPASAP